LFLAAKATYECENSTLTLIFTMVHQNSGVFDAMNPFVEVVFWNLGNGEVFRVKPT